MELYGLSVLAGTVSYLSLALTLSQGYSSMDFILMFIGIIFLFISSMFQYFSLDYVYYPRWRAIGFSALILSLLSSVMLLFSKLFAATIGKVWIFDMYLSLGLIIGSILYAFSFIAWVYLLIMMKKCNM